MVSTAVSKTVFPSEGVGIGSSPIEATKLNNMNKEILQKLMNNAIDILEIIDSSITNSLLQNEQFVLNFYDKINEISVRK